MEIALLCSGLGNIQRGHETFARDLFGLLRDSVAITVFKGGGGESERERVIEHIPRNSPLLDKIHVAVSPRWESAAQEQERLRIEAETFAYGALKPLLEVGYDIVHCLEQEVCNIVFDNRHLFQRVPKVVFSNGGAIPARDLPRCDFVQEHTAHNLKYSHRTKAFMIPHGVDVERFRPGIPTDFRARHGIPQDAFVAICVGTICYQHKRTDYVIREVAALTGAWLIVAGQENQDSEAIKELGRRLMGDRIVFTTLSQDELPPAYAAADVFVLGSLFETFGIVYIEAMASGVPVFCTEHPNQRSIVQEGVFVDMTQAGSLTAALRNTPRDVLRDMARRGRAVAERDYDLRLLKQRYLDQYARIAAAPCSLPVYNFKNRVRSNLRNLGRRAAGLIHGRAE